MYYLIFYISMIISIGLLGHGVVLWILRLYTYHWKLPPSPPWENMWVRLFPKLPYPPCQLSLWEETGVPGENPRPSDILERLRFCFIFKLKTSMTSTCWMSRPSYLEIPICHQIFTLTTAKCLAQGFRFFPI
jgi:hypothetical protein